MVSYEDFLKMDIKIAEIKNAREHPEADRLMVLEIDVGGESKQIVAGIKGFYGKDELVGRKIVVLNNLEPVVLRGETSNGMLLAASGEGGSPILLVPDKEVAPGSPVK